MGTKITISRSEEAMVYQIMKKVIREVGEGICEYVEDYSDKKVLEDFLVMVPGSPIAVSHISNYRLDVFGKLRPGRTAPLVEMEELRTRLERLEQWAAARPKGAFEKK
jgi:hypothetical protein